MGWNNLFQCEKDEWCLKLLNQNYPNTHKHGDIKTTDFSIYRGRVDIITGGFPCQPYSTAGKRLGKGDERHLWPEMLRAIREVQPPWVVGENVRGLTNWNGGLVFDEVQADLEAAGYEVTPFLLPAAGVNAPHRRDRIWFIAYSAGFRCNRELYKGEGIQWGEQARTEVRGSNTETTYDTNGNERPERGLYTVGSETAVGYPSALHARVAGYWEDFPTQSGICGRNDGIPFELDLIKRIENEQGFYKGSIKSPNVAIWTLLRAVWEQREFAKASHRVYADNIYHPVSDLSCSGAYERWNMGQRIEEDEGLRNLWEAFYSVPFEEAQDLQQKLLIKLREGERRKKMEQKQRVNRLKGLGNAVVPQVVLQIFKAIQAYEDLKQ